jgi:hypothetical protein
MMSEPLEPGLPRPVPRPADAEPTGLEPVVSSVLDRLRLDPSGLTAEEFPRLLRAIAWLSQCGRPLPASRTAGSDDPADPPVEPLADWRDWGGFGKDAGVIRLYVKLKVWNEEAEELIQRSPVAVGNALLQMRDRIRERVGYVSPRFGADGAGASAVASRALGMLQRVLVPVGVLSAAGRPIPPKLPALWRWFAVGRWPCAYWRPKDFGTLRLLVY